MTGDRVRRYAPKSDQSDDGEVVRLLPSREPKAIDFLCPHSGARREGIYKLAGDTLTFCTQTWGERRPTSFADNSDGVMLLVLRRK